MDKKKNSGFQIAGNLYFVGVVGFSSHLLTSPAGHILLDTGMPASGAAILGNIRELGFHPTDVKYILISHAHIDHLGGAPLLARETGASVCVHADDVPAAEQGSPREDLERKFPPVHVDRVLQDGDAIRAGTVTVDIYHTSGHSPGCLSFGFDVQDGDRVYRAMLFGGPGINYGKDPATWPAGRKRIETYLASVKKLYAMSPDIWLGAHPQFSQTFEKNDRRIKGETPNPFIDPQGWKLYISARIERAETLLTELDAQVQAG